MMLAANKRMDEREKNAKEEFDKKLVTVDQVHSQKDKASEACEAQKLEKREVRNQINKDITDALQRKKQEEEAEMAKKQELIR